jgi:hypothetical protein
MHVSRLVVVSSAAFLLFVSLSGCGDDDGGSPSGSAAQAGSGGTGTGGTAGTGGGGGVAGTAGTGGIGGAGGSGGSGGTSAGGTAGTGASGGSGGASGSAGSAGVAGAAGSSGSGGSPTCTLVDSGPVEASTDGQVIENLRITSTSGPAIRVAGRSNVVIRNVQILHSGGSGIEVSDAPDTTIEHVSVEHTGAPASGENPSDGLINISCYASARIKVAHARLTRGSSGVYLHQCPDSVLQFLEGHDFRGPFPRGQLVQWNASDQGLLEDFSVENPPGSWPEDNVNVYKSMDATIRRGLVDGNNSPSGVGVIFDGDTSTGLVEDVDAIRMGNGCFSNYAGAEGNVFRRTRCRENICEDQGRGLPGSNALMWAGRPGLSQIRLEDSQYFAACNAGNIVWPQDSFEVVEVTEQDFALRAPIRVDLCWE